MSDKSGFERGLLLELWIGRVVAWLAWLSVMALIVVAILGVGHLTFWQYTGIFVVLILTAVWSAKCEYRAENMLADIWKADTLRGIK